MQKPTPSPKDLLDEMEGKANVIMATGSRLYQKGNYPEAIDMYNQALEIYTTIGNLPKIGEAYQNLGTAYRNIEQYEIAYEYFNKSMSLNQELGRIAEVAWTLRSIVRAQDMEGKGEEAIETEQEAIDTYLGMIARKEAADGFTELAELQTKYDKKDDANVSLEQAAMLYEELNLLDQASQCRAKKMPDC